MTPRPSVLLLDELFSSLDARLHETVREETMAILHETNVTSLIVTHDPKLIHSAERSNGSAAT
ncbi:MAG: hypothetical protein MO846_02220 [Candidatus Devosia symbiotica]|nr:hypothetical protein [Candidatus Devosia symbiotica]